VRALWGAGDKETAIPALKRLVEAEARTKSFKSLALVALQRWGSDAGVEFCKGALSSENDTGLLASCVDYLGRMKVKEALPGIGRVLEKEPEVALRALGQIGDPASKATVSGWLTEKDTQNTMFKIPAWIALANLGDKSGMEAINTVLDGRQPMNKKEQEKAKTAKKPAPPKEADDRMIQAAVMETLNLDEKQWKAVTPKLQKLTKESDPKKWRVALYANVALAQRGDANAAKKLAAELENPKEEIRKSALDAVGGLDAAPGSNFMNRGLGVVADPIIADAALKFYDAESKKDVKAKALQTAAAVRAASVNLKK